MTARTRTPSAIAAPEAPEASPSGPAGRRWLVLTHRLPPRPSYLRIKVRRQLQRIGAVALKNSVYVLPPGEETREDFEWLCREIERAGGDTTLSLATFLDDGTDARIVAALREARAADYRAIASAARRAAARATARRRRADPGPARAAAHGLRRRFAAASAIDFAGADGRDEALRALSDLEALARGERAPAGAAARPATAPAAAGPTGRVWVTRRGIKVDRMASAWLIRRFIDPAATFRFVPASAAAARPGELRFDMFGGEFTHEGERCTFETLLARHGLDDPALAAIAEIVHDLDCKDDRFGRPETSGIAAAIDGIVRTTPADEDRLRRGAALFDGLLEHFRSV